MVHLDHCGSLDTSKSCKFLFVYSAYSVCTLFMRKLSVFISCMHAINAVCTFIKTVVLRAVVKVGQ